MSLLNTGISAIGKLLIVVALAVAFLIGMLGVVAFALRGEEVKVPEIVGKDFLDSEKELTELGLKIKKRALRYSEEKPNTILEQLPKPGETVKTGQIILVVVSQENPEGQEAPATVKKDEEPTEEANTAPEAVSPDKPKKVTNKNTDTNKRATTTRDVVANKQAKPANTASNASSGANTKANASGPATTATPKPTPGQNAKPSPTPARPTTPTANKPSTTGDTRTRKVP